MPLVAALAIADNDLRMCNLFLHDVYLLYILPYHTCPSNALTRFGIRCGSSPGSWSAPRSVSGLDTAHQRVLEDNVAGIRRRCFPRHSPGGWALENPGSLKAFLGP